MKICVSAPHCDVTVRISRPLSAPSAEALFPPAVSLAQIEKQTYLPPDRLELELGLNGVACAM